MANDIQTRNTFRRKLGLDTRSATAGDSAGVVYEPGRSGYCRVRYPSADGFGFPTVVRLKINIDLKPGTPVIVGYDRDGQAAVVDVDFDGMEAGNYNPLVTTTINPTTNGVDLNLSPILISTPFGAAKPLYVTLFPFKYIRNGTIHTFTGASGGIDLSSFVPGSADQHCVVGIFVTPSDASETKASAAQSTGDPLTDDDFQECITASTDGGFPVAFWRLRTSQTLISDTDKYWDARQWINVPENDFATVQTTDATQTTIASVSVAESSLLTITGTFSGVRSTYAAAISGTFVAGIRRASGGSATLVGVTVTSNTDGVTPSFTVDADVGTNTARLRVTGIGSQTWNWSANYKCLVT